MNGKIAHRLERARFQVNYCLNTIKNIRERIKKERLEKNFPSETPDCLAKFLLDLYETLEHYLRYQYQEELNEIKLCDLQTINCVEKKIVSNYRICVFLSEYIGYISCSSTSDLPWRLVNQIERICKLLIPESKVIIYPRWNFNYTHQPISIEIVKAIKTVHFHDENLFNALYEKIKRHEKFFALGFPIVSKDNILDISILAHEIGHLVDSYNGKIFFDYNDEESYSEKILNELIKNEPIEKVPETKEMKEWISFTKSKSDQIKKWGKEIFADLFSVLLFGPAAILSIFDLVNYTEIDRPFDVNDSHPPFNIRARILHFSYEKWISTNETWINNLPSSYQEGIREGIGYLDEICKKNKDSELANETLENIPDRYFDSKELLDLIEKMCAGIYEELELADYLGCHDCFMLPDVLPFLDLEKTFNDLENCLPPFICVKPGNKLNGIENRSFSILLNTGWFYLLAHRDLFDSEKKENGPFSDEKNRDEENRKELDFVILNNMIAKSLESIEAINWMDERVTQSIDITGKSETQSYIDTLLDRETNFLKIIPLLNRSHQVDRSSIDIRLGSEFIVTKLHSVTKIDATNYNDELNSYQYQSRIYIPFGKPYILHPGKFILANTLEYVVMPDDYFALVVGRSSWGRLGLNIATAAKVDPGFKGCITLEINNLGEIPIFLYPGSRIGQLVLINVKKNNEQI